MGLSDGSASSNMKILKDLKSGKYDKKEETAETNIETNTKLPMLKAVDKVKDVLKYGGTKKATPMYKMGGVKRKTATKKK